MADPLCTFFGKCGGCSFQDQDYEEQLTRKKNILAREVKCDDIEVFSDKAYFYRNRMDFVVRQDGIGFRQKGTWDKSLKVEECKISNPRLNELLREVNDFFRKPDFFDPKRQTGTFKYAVIRTPSGGASISFILNQDSTKISSAIEQIKEFASKTSAENVIVGYVPKKADMSISEEYFAVKGDEMLKETLMGKEFLFHSQGFFQNNSRMAEKMHVYCHELLKRHGTKDAQLLDLYGGVGAFGINNANLFKEVVTVESYAPSTEVAKKNIELNETGNVRAETVDAKHLKKLKFSKPLCVLNDPPRSGMNPKTIEQLNNLEPEAIIYISCNVQQLGKDISKFKKYGLRSVALFDLFPQTPHIEAVVELIKN